MRSPLFVKHLKQGLVQRVSVVWIFRSEREEVCADVEVAHQQTRQVRDLETVKRHAESVRGNPKKPKTQLFATHEARVKSLVRVW